MTLLSCEMYTIVRQFENSIVHCVCVQYIYIYTYHIIFIQFSVDGHLGCFHALAIVNTAAMNIGVHVYFGAMFFFGYITRSGIAESSGSYFQFFKEPPCYSPEWLYQFTFPPTVQEGSLLSTPSPAFVVCGLFDERMGYFLFLPYLLYQNHGYYISGE